MKIFWGQVPFPHLQNDTQVLLHLLKPNASPVWPEALDVFKTELGKLVTQCWRSDASLRPDVAQLKVDVEALAIADLDLSVSAPQSGSDGLSGI